MRKIKLSQGKYALVDDADFEFLSQWKWHAHKALRSRTWYARRSVHLKDQAGVYICRPVTMHRVIMGAKKGQIVDHINMNGLDNRRANLRFVDKYQSMQNRGHGSGSTKIRDPKGVAKYIIGRVTVDGVRHYLGVFKTVKAASAAVKSVRKNLWRV